jgi:rod shape-determining protein MreB
VAGLKEFISNFYWQMGVDLGSSHIGIYLKGKGIVVDEPSQVVRLKKKKGGQSRFLVFGQKAKETVSREPKLIEVVSPVKKGVVVDLEAAEALAGNYLKLIFEIPSGYPRLLKPRAIVAVSSQISEVQRRAYVSVFNNAGAGEVILVDSGVAGALGSGYNLDESGGLLMVDIGGSKTEISLVSMGGLVIGRCLELGGDNFDEAIINYVKMKYGLLIGKNSAEKLKIGDGGIVRGRDLEHSLPKSLRVSGSEIQEAVAFLVNKIVRTVGGILDEMPTEMTEDILKRGIVLIGGTAQMVEIAKVIEEETKISTVVVDEPTQAVIRGCGVLLEDPGLLKRVKTINNR